MCISYVICCSCSYVQLLLKPVLYNSCQAILPAVSLNMYLGNVRINILLMKNIGLYRIMANTVDPLQSSQVL